MYASAQYINIISIGQKLIRVLNFILYNTTDVKTCLLNVDRKTPVRSGHRKKTGAERTSQWTSSSTWESPASYPVTSRVFAVKRETPLTRETRTLRCGPHSRVSADYVQGYHVSWYFFIWWCNAVGRLSGSFIPILLRRYTHPLWV